MRTVPALKTTRCELTQIKEGDFDNLYLMVKDRDVKKFLPEFYEIMESKSDFLSIMESFAVLWDKGISVLWGIYLNHELIGFIGLLDIPINATLFYSIEKGARSQGFAKETVKSVLSFVFNSGLTDEILTEVYTDNIASIRVLINNGFVEFSRSDDKALFKKSSK